MLISQEEDLSKNNKDIAYGGVPNLDSKEKCLVVRHQNWLKLCLLPKQLDERAVFQGFQIRLSGVWLCTIIFDDDRGAKTIRIHTECSKNNCQRDHKWKKKWSFWNNFLTLQTIWISIYTGHSKSNLKVLIGGSQE